MRPAGFFIGLFMLLLGAGYLCRPDKVSSFNSWCRNNLFSDRHLIISRRKTGVLLIFSGLMLLLLALW